MTRQEIMATRVGEMRDMISCLAIYNGAEPKRKKKSLPYEQAVKLR